jgi:ribosomal protein S12 methylthiotransferase
VSRTKVGVVSLGCSKNLVDTEVMLGHLDGAGYAFVQDADEADVLVVNTCAFIEAAREESIRTILDAAALKKEGRLKRLVVAGCMVQRYRAELSAELSSEVDAFVGLDELASIVPAAGGVKSDLRVLPPGAKVVEPSRYLYDARTPRRLSTSPWTAFVKIAEGCDHTCSFCAIPVFRGAFRSRTPEDVAAEVEALARAGVREVNLIAQDSSHYGRDRDDRAGLPGLLGRLDAIDAIRWVRVHYLYPNTVTDRLIGAMAELPRVVPYVDMPLQHAHPDTLRRMRRGGSAESHLALLDRFRRALLDFVEAAGFDHLGVFTYSHEETTGAFGSIDDVPAEVKDARKSALMEAQQRIAFARNARRIGAEVEVLLEGAHEESDDLLVGRMATQAPDVDGQVIVNDGFVTDEAASDPRLLPHARPGAFARVLLTETAGYDLVGRIVGAA